MCEIRKTIDRWTVFPVEAYHHARYYKCTIWTAIFFALEMVTVCQGWNKISDLCAKIGKWSPGKK